MKSQRKAVHGLDSNCEDCIKIFGFIVDEGPKGIRHNALLRACRKNTSEKYSAPKLERHLNGLVGGKFVKKTRKGPQNVIYSAILPKERIQWSRFDLEKKVEELRKLPLSQLIEKRIGILNYAIRQQLILDMERRLNQCTKEERAFNNWQMTMALRVTMNQYDVATANHQESEYLEVLKNLKNERDMLLKQRAERTDRLLSSNT
jgi:hypothetical protein